VATPFRSLRGLATALTVLLAIIAAVAGVLVPVGLYARGVVHDATIFGRFRVTERVDDALDLVNGFASFYFLLFIAIAVLWMIWMYRAAANVRLFRRARQRFSPGFAIGGWFIPFANLLIPGMQMYDIDKGSGPPAGPGAAPPRGSGRLVLWWVVFVAAELGAGFGQTSVKPGRLYLTSDFDWRNAVFVAAMVAAVVAAALAVLVVRAITAAQHDSWDAMAGPAAPGPFGAPGASAWSTPVPGGTTPPPATPPPPPWPSPPPSDP
jgi:hypothetical protein